MTDKVNILAQEKSKTIKLADGKDYILPPIDMTTLANIEKTMGFGLGKLQAKLETETATTMRIMIYALLKEEKPDLDIDTIGHLITLKEMTTIAGVISEIMAISS